MLLIDDVTARLLSEFSALDVGSITNGGGFFADAGQRVASASEEEISKILDGRDSKRTKNVIKTA